MAVDYLKTYLGIDPDDYSSMEARIRGEEPQARVPFMRQPMMMPQRRSLSDIEAMPSMPRVQIQPQVDDRYQSLMDEIASLKAQIDALQAPTEQAPVMVEQAPVMVEQAPVMAEQAPVMADTPTEVSMEDAREMFYQSPEFKDYQERTKNMVQNMAYMPKTYTDPVTGKTTRFDDRSGLFQDWYKNTYGRDLSIENGFGGSLGSSLDDMLDRSNVPQAPVGIENRMVGEPVPFVVQEPVPFVAQEPVPAPTPVPVIPQAEAGITNRIIGEQGGFNKPDSFFARDSSRAFEPHLDHIRSRFDRESTTEPTPAPVIPQAPSQDIQSSIDYLAKLPKMNIPQIPDVEEIKRKIAEANLTLPTPVSYEEQLQSIRDLPKITQMPTREEIETAMQNIPTSVSANVTQNPFQKINDILPQSTINKFQAVASKPNNFMGDSARNIMSQIQQPQMQSFGRPQLPFQGGFMPEMRAGGGGIDKAIYDLKFKLNGR